MAVPWDVWGMGVAMGSAAGLVAGYQLRKLVVHIQEYRVYRISKRDIKIAYEHDQIVSLVEHREMPAMLPIKRSRRTTPIVHVQEQPSPVNNSWRDDVINALMGAGYKKTDAVKATDACALGERASGPEQWTIAALSNASRSKQ